MSRSSPVIALFVCVRRTAARPRPAQAAPDHVDITWMSIANMHFGIGRQQIVADGYITRLPQDLFFGGASGCDSTTARHAPGRAPR